MGTEHTSHTLTGARTRLAPGQLAWLVLGTLIPIGCVLVAALGLFRVQVPQGAIYEGRLRPLDDPASLVLPALLTVSEVLTQEGQRVDKGRALFRLDAELGASILAELELEAQRIRLFRECLLSWPFDPFAGRRADPAEQGSLPTTERRHTDILVETAAACDLRRSAVAATLFYASATEENLRKRLSLLDKKTHLLRLDQPRQSTHGAAYEALSLALAHNLLSAELIEAQSALREARLAEKEALLREAREALDQVNNLRDTITHLKRRLSDPVVRAPFDGVVRRVRVAPHEGGLQSDIPAVELQPLDTGYIVDAVMPAPHAAMIEDGRSVYVDLPIAGRQLTRLQAHASGAVPSDVMEPPDQVTASFVLDRASSDALASGQTGLALHGTATAATVRLKLAPEPVATRLIKAASDALRPGATWWQFGATAQDRVLTNIVPLRSRHRDGATDPAPPGLSAILAPEHLGRSDAP